MPHTTGPPQRPPTNNPPDGTLVVTPGGGPSLCPEGNTWPTPQSLSGPCPPASNAHQQSGSSKSTTCPTSSTASPTTPNKPNNSAKIGRASCRERGSHNEPCGDCTQDSAGSS